MNPLELERKAAHAERQLQEAVRQRDKQAVVALMCVLEDIDRDLAQMERQWSTEVRGEYLQ